MNIKGRFFEKDSKIYFEGPREEFKLVDNLIKEMEEEYVKQKKA